jgi:hypothetical protein
MGLEPVHAFLRHEPLKLARDSIEKALPSLHKMFNQALAGRRAKKA